MTFRSLGLLLLLGSVWGASFLFIKVVVEETSPLALVQGRITFGALAVVIDVTDSSVLGQMAVVGAAACYGAAAVYARILLRSEDPLDLCRLQLVIGALILAPALFAVDGVPNYNLSLEAWLSLITLGVLGTGLAYMAFFWLLGAIGSVRTSLVTYIVPITGLTLGWAVLDESIGINSVVGCALIILGVTTVIRRR